MRRHDAATERPDLSFDPGTLLPDDCGPYATYRHLRGEWPIYQSPSGGFWALSRFDDVRTASRDWETFSNAGGVDLDELGRLVFGPGDFLDMDPPEHDELRAVVKSRFTPKSVATLQPMVQGHVDELLARLVAARTADAVEHLACALPFHVMCSIFGFASGDRPELRRLYRTVMQRRPGAVTIPRHALEAATEMRSYLLAEARERRGRPRDDLMTQVALTEVDGTRLLECKLVGMCFVLFSAGIDTVAGLLGNAVLLLAEHPDQRRLVLHDPLKLPAAIEEVLRYESPLQFNARTTTRRVTVGGDVIPAGARVLLLYGSANRDERRRCHPGVGGPRLPPPATAVHRQATHDPPGQPLLSAQREVEAVGE